MDRKAETRQAPHNIYHKQSKCGHQAHLEAREHTSCSRDLAANGGPHASSPVAALCHTSVTATQDRQSRASQPQTDHRMSNPDHKEAGMYPPAPCQFTRCTDLSPNSVGICDVASRGQNTTAAKENGSKKSVATLAPLSILGTIYEAK